MSKGRVNISAHARERYRERVEDIPDADIDLALSGRAFAALDEMGAGAIILPGGQRAVVRNHTIITILPKGYRVHKLRGAGNEDRHSDG